MSKKYLTAWCGRHLTHAHNLITGNAAANETGKLWHWWVRKCLGFETLTFQRDPVPFQARSAIGERNKKLYIIMTDYSLSNLKTSLMSLDSTPLKLTYVNKK